MTLPRQCVLISSDRRFQRLARPALMAAGCAVETAACEDPLPAEVEAAELAVFHVNGADPHYREQLAKLIKRLSDAARVAVIVPEPDLGTIVELMRTPRVYNVLTEEQATAGVLAGIASRHLNGDVFGLDPFLPFGVHIYSMLVGDYQEKTVAIATVTDYAASVGVRRKYLHFIEKVMDELLMNALYDAPVDTDGRMLFADVSTRDRIEMQLEQKASLKYACDGQLFAVSVKDNYGTLEKDVVLKYLYKCLHKEDQIDRKEGGAGLGLYIVTNSVNQYIVNVQPGMATEAICLFDLTAPRPVLSHFGVFFEKVELLEQVRRGDPTLDPAPRRKKTSAATEPAKGVPLPYVVILAATALLLLAALIVVLWSKL